MTPAGETPEYPFWGYEDLALFLGAVLPSFALAALIVRTSRITGETATTLLYQTLIYVFLLGVLYLLIARRYHRPFWRSLRWTGAYRGVWLCVLAGPVLAILTVILGLILREPAISSPIEELVSDRQSLAILGLFITVFGPAFEELTFRGFLLPLLTRSLGVWPGILAAAIPFALLHGNEYRWAWQQLAIVGIAGAAFGYARVKTRSTLAAAALHASFNTTMFAGYVFEKLAYNSR